MDSKAENYQYNFNVGMTCDGCSGAIKRILDKEDSKEYHKTRSSF